MLTSVLLSNISYNSEEFLKHQLDELIKGKQIGFYAFIFHKAECDYGEKHDHRHLLIRPETRLDTLNLDEHFFEPDPDPNQNLPLRCIDWNKTKHAIDWYLYAVHDPTYCKLKHGEEKMYHYDHNEIITSDQLVLDNIAYKSYHENKFWKSTKWQKFFNDGLTAAEIVKNGYVDPSEMVAFHHFIQILNLTY